MVSTSSKTVSKNALPILAYYDIFKNYYANTQEENFYILGNTEEIIVTINGKRVIRVQFQVTKVELATQD